MRTTLSLFMLLALLLTTPGCAKRHKADPVADAPKVETPQPEAKREEPSPNKPFHPSDGPAPPMGQSYDFKIGQPITRGDLTITIKDAVTLPIFGTHYGQPESMKVLLIAFDIKNNSVGKITDWAGWQGSGVVVDEFGNKFKPVDTDGWVNLPNNAAYGPHGDYGTRINPGQTYSDLLFFQPMPDTSHNVTITLPVNGRDWKFSGKLLTPEERTQKAKEAAAKAEAERQERIAKLKEEEAKKLAEEKKTRPAIPDTTIKVGWANILGIITRQQGMQLNMLNRQTIEVSGPILSCVGSRVVLGVPTDTKPSHTVVVNLAYADEGEGLQKGQNVRVVGTLEVMIALPNKTTAEVQSATLQKARLKKVE